MQRSSLAPVTRHTAWLFRRSVPSTILPIGLRYVLLVRGDGVTGDHASDLRHLRIAPHHVAFSQRPIRISLQQLIISSLRSHGPDKHHPRTCSHEVPHLGPRISIGFANPTAQQRAAPRSSAQSPVPRSPVNTASPTMSRSSPVSSPLQLSLPQHRTPTLSPSPHEAAAGAATLIIPTASRSTTVPTTAPPAFTPIISTSNSSANTIYCHDQQSVRSAWTRQTARQRGYCSSGFRCNS